MGLGGRRGAGVQVQRLARRSDRDRCRRDRGHDPSGGAATGSPPPDVRVGPGRGIRRPRLWSGPVSVRRGSRRVCRLASPSAKLPAWAGSLLSSFRSQADQAVAPFRSRILVFAGSLLAGVVGAGFRCLAERRRPDAAHLGIVDDHGFEPRGAPECGLVARPWDRPGVGGEPGGEGPGSRGLVAGNVAPDPFLSSLRPALAADPCRWLDHRRRLVDLWAEGRDRRERRVRGLRSGSRSSRLGLASGGWSRLWHRLGYHGMSARILPGLFDPSDSLREGAKRVVSILPEDTSVVRIPTGVPSLTYYLLGRVPIRPQLRSGMFSGRWIHELGVARRWDGSNLEDGRDHPGRERPGNSSSGSRWIGACRLRSTSTRAWRSGASPVTPGWLT